MARLSDAVLWAIAVILCGATVISGAEIVWLFLLAGAFARDWSTTTTGSPSSSSSTPSRWV
jgi:hypothetical protein